jgi:hypothetical protein
MALVARRAESATRLSQRSAAALRIAGVIAAEEKRKHE